MRKFNIINKLQKQRGAALLLMVVILVVGAMAMLVNSLSASSLQLRRDKATADALAQAKEALIGYATSVQITNSSFSLNDPRPGDLPCPDTNNDGDQDSPCGNAAGTTGQSLRLGRLPWKTLGLNDLRDGSGERLWYAVSNNFKEHWNTTLTPLNSDTTGTITVRAPDGSLLNDGSSTSGAVAIIIAPREVIKRTDKAVPQDRSSASVNLPENYLETANGEDNANFADNQTNGFIQGSIKDASGNLILNDQILVITQDNIMQAIQKRVAAEVKNCLDNYASLNNGRYPWATPISDTTNYLDQTNTLFGRIPDDMSNTRIVSGNVMSKQWIGINCKTHSANTPSTWWKQWRELVFYGLADAYKPASTLPAPVCGTCLTVTSASAASDKKFVVIVAGKILPSQTNRPINKSTLSNYLEPPNSGGVTTFSQGSPSATFNDTVFFKQ